MAATELQIDAANRLQIVLEGAKQGQANEISKNISELGNEISILLLSIDLQSITVIELNRLLEDSGLVVSGYFNGLYTSNLNEFVTEVAGLSVDVEVDTLNEAIESKDFEAKRPSEDAIKSEFDAKPLGDNKTAELVSGALLSLSLNESSRIKNVIRSAYYTGQTSQQAVTSVIGTSAANFNNGALAATQRNAESVMRTVSQHSMATSRVATFAANDINKYEWVSTLDSRTSNQCKSLDGQVFIVGKGPLPPIHYNCRSTIVASLDGRLSVSKSRGTRTARGDTGRTTRIGANTSYYEWLKRQPADFQDRALGQTRGSLFRNGGLTSEEFRKLNLNRKFLPLNLAQMRAINPQAFTRAGI